MSLNFFGEAYLVENRCEKYIKNIIETFIYIEALSEGPINYTSLLELPYPLFKQLVIGKTKEKERQKKELERLKRRQQKQKY